MPSPRTPLLAVAAAGLLLSACTSSPDQAPATPSAAADTVSGATHLAADDAVTLLDQRDDVTVIDVRTPAEHAQGHLAGSLLLDIQGPSFTSELDALDRDGAYLVYCRRGNRSATAVDRMAALGFTEVYDAGAYHDLAAAGAATS